MKADFSDEQVSDSLQLVVERMAHAQWVKGRALVTPKGVSLEWTDLGKRQLQKLAGVLRPFEDRFVCGGDRKPSLWQHLKLRWFLSFHAARLNVARMSRRDDLALIVLLATEARKLRLGEN